MALYIGNQRYCPVIAVDKGGVEPIPTTVLNKTGQKVNTGDKVWVNTKKENYTKVGNPTINSDYTVSGFSSSDYLLISNLDFSSADSWEQVWKITKGSSTGSSFYICDGNTNPVFNFGDRGGIWTFYLSSNGSSWDLASEITKQIQVKTNTEYTVKMSYLNSVYNLDISENNGLTWINAGSITSDKKVFSTSSYCIGNTYDKLWPWNGSIDLKESYIKINGTEVWRGVKDISPNQLVNFSDINNYSFTANAKEDIEAESTGEVYINGYGEIQLKQVDTQLDKIIDGE